MPRVNTSTKSDIKYPEVKVSLRDSNNPITAANAEQILGWRELAEDSKEDFLLKDVTGKKIRCENNLKNRDLILASVNLLKQEILRGRWSFNGEPIIIGTNGSLLNGQHSLIALVLAVQEWEAHPENYPFWEEEPTIAKLIVFGVSEDDDIVNTMDTCKPRTLSDVVFRSEHLQDIPVTTRKKIAKTTEHAIKLVWSRTGVSDAYSIKRTHREAMEFLNNHLNLIKCVEYITEEDAGSEKQISRYITAGYASGLMYLMAASATEGRAYLDSDVRFESELDMSHWDKAEEFFTVLSNGTEGGVIRKALGKLVEDGIDSHEARQGVLIKAWNCFVEGTKITPNKLTLKYVEKDDICRLAEFPSLGGIDVGDDDNQAPSDPVEEPKAEKAKTSKPKSTRSRAKKSEANWKVGDEVLCIDPDDEESTWFGKIVELNGATAKVEAGEGQAGAGTAYEWPTENLRPNS